MFKNIPAWGILVALLTGSYYLAFVFSAAGCVVGIGFFLSLGRSRQALHDRVSHTAVYAVSRTSR